MSAGAGWNGWTLDLGIDAGSWPVVRGDSPAGEVVVDAPEPWRVQAADALGGEIETTAVHPGGAVMRIRQSLDESWDVRVAIGLPEGADGPVTVPGPRWRFGAEDPVQVWTAGADGLMLTDRDRRSGLRILWRQIAGDCCLDPDAVRPLGRTVVLDPGRTRTAVWRGTRVDEVARAAAMLPSWLPDELLLDPTVDQEIRLDTPDAGLLLDGLPTGEWVGGAGDHDLFHELEVRQARGTTRLVMGWAVMPQEHSWRRAEEILADLDPRRATGAQLWILLQGVPLGAARGQDVAAAVAESLENRLARPGADFFTVVSAVALASQIGDADIWDSAMEALEALPPDAPGTLIGHALARSRASLHGWRVPDPQRWTGSADPLVRAERAVLLGPGRSPDPDPDALEALWWLGSALPAPGPRPLMGRHGLVGPSRSAWAVAITSFWPQWWEVATAWAADVTRLRQRAARRLLLDPGLEDETLALLLW